jgi:hypothetical protein
MTTITLQIPDLERSFGIHKYDYAFKQLKTQRFVLLDASNYERNKPFDRTYLIKKNNGYP